MTSLLTLSVLGPFQALFNGQPVEFATDKTRALLLYLAVEADIPHRRESLAALLYPDYPDQDALNNLRKSLFRLRDALNRHAPPLSEPLLTITRPTIQLNAAFLKLDITDFHRAVHLSSQARWSDMELAQANAAVKLYRGEVAAGLALNDAYPFEEWLLLQREAHHQQMLQLCGAVAGAYMARGAFAQGLPAARAAVALEPWREEGHVQLMRLLALDGQPHEALAQYERCCRWLESEFGVPPEAQTVALAAEIRAGNFQSHTIPVVIARPRLHGFPAQFTSFLGRDHALEAVTTQLSQPDCRLLTLVGAGGMGKTRLSVQVAQALAHPSPPLFQDGIYFVGCAALRSLSELQSTVATTLGIIAQGNLTQAQQIQNFVREKSLLLVLDNLEHLLECGEWLAQMVADAPGLKILATSREPLRIRAEWCYGVEGLSLEGGRTSPAYQLFIQRARQVVPSFHPSPEEEEAIGQIALMVDGSPLGLEIAATWVRFYDCAMIRTQIQTGAEFLETEWQDIAERHRSVRAVFDHSWQLLSAAEQVALRQLSVFRGDWRLPQALAVVQCTPRELVRLGDKSLVRRTASGRYTLHEVVRQFAEARLLQSGESDEVQQRHAHFFLHALATHRPALASMKPQEAVATVRQEWVNIRVAWATAVRQQQWSLLLESLEAYKLFIELTGWTLEGISDVTLMVERAGSGTRHNVALSVQGAGGAVLGWFSMLLNPSDPAMEYLEPAWNLPPTPQNARWRGDAWSLRGRAFVNDGDVEQANRCFEEAERCYTLGGHALGIAQLISIRAQALAKMGRSEEALPRFQEALDRFERLGYPLEISAQLRHIGVIYINRGDYEKARLHYERSLHLINQLNAPLDVSRQYNNLGVVHTYLGNYVLAIEYYQHALELDRQAGVASGVATKTGNIGLVYRLQKQYEPALRCFQEAVGLARQLQLKGVEANYLGCQGGLYAELGDFEQAKRDLEASLALARQYQHRLIEATCGRLLAQTLFHLGEIHPALTLIDEVIEAQTRYQRRHHLALALYDNAEMLYALEEYEGAIAAVTGAAEAQQNTPVPQAEQWQVAALAARLDALQGNQERAIATLLPLLAVVDRDESRADVLFRLWEVTHQEIYRKQAIELYQRLQAELALYLYGVRLKALNS